MKKITTLFVLAWVMVSPVLAQQSVTIKPKIQEITVYLSGAEVRFKEQVSLKRGDNIIIFKGLAPSLVPNSVQVSMAGDATILSVSTQSEQLSPEEVSQKFKTLKDSLALLEDQIVLIANQIDAYDMEKKTLLQNQDIGGTQTGVSLVELTKAADFFRERTLKINNALTSLNKNLKLLKVQQEKKNGQINTELGKIDVTRHSVTVTVSARTDQSADFIVRHLVEAASWEPSYDIIATEINKPVIFKYKAQIYNYTGVDWRSVKLSLSTGDISVSATRPYLTAWTLNYASQANEGFLNTTAQNVLQKESGSDSREDVEEKSVSELNTSFEIEQRHSIYGDGQPYRIDLQSETLQASYEYLTVPKMELSAFLIAKVTGWQKLNLIDGMANVYYGNTFIGESNINTRLIGDTLELSLGRDNQIVVSRTKVEDKGSTPAWGAKRSESFVYEIQLKNNRKVPVSMKVQDQIPISQEKDITVDVEEISNASLDSPSGRLQWMKALPPGETARYKIAFTVRYPKNRTVNIRKSRLVRTPRYKH